MSSIFPTKRLTDQKDGFALKTVISVILSVLVIAAAIFVSNALTGEVKAAGTDEALEGECSIARSKGETYDVTMPDGQTLKGSVVSSEAGDPLPSNGSHSFNAVPQSDGTYAVTVFTTDGEGSSGANPTSTIVCDGWSPVSKASFFVEMSDESDTEEVEGGSKLVGSATGISFLLTRVDSEGAEQTGRERITVDLDATGKAMDVSVPFGEYSVEQVSGNSIASAHTPNKNIVIDRLSQYFILNVDAK